MKRVFTGLLLLSALGSLSAQAVLSQIQGKVEVRLPGSAAWTAAAEQQSLPVEAQISTGLNSSVQVDIGGNTVQIRPLTRMALGEYLEREGTANTGLRLGMGRVRVEVRSTETRRNNFTVTSPVATASVRGTSFGFDGHRLEVFSGAVAYGSGPNATTIVPAGASSQLSGNGAGAPPLPPAAVQENAGFVPAQTLPPSAAPQIPTSVTAPLLPPPAAPTLPPPFVPPLTTGSLQIVVE